MDKVEALREELRNGRRSGEAGESLVGHSAGPNEQVGSSIQEPGRDNKPTRRNRRTPASYERSIEEKSKRVRQGSGRSGDDGSGAANGDIQSQGNSGRTISAIERLDEVPERIDNEIPLQEKPVGRYREDYSKTERNGKYVYYLLADRTQTITPEQYKALPNEKDAKTSAFANGISENIKKVGESIFPSSKGTTLSQTEAKELLEPLASAIQDYGGYVDRFLQYRTQEPAMSDIWGDLTELEAQVLARIMIRRGQKNAAAATVVREMVNSSDYVQAAIIIVPRAMKTVEMTRRTSKKARMRVVQP